MAETKTRLAILTQDPAHYGGVLRLVEYIYERATAAGLDPKVVHYARFESHPELHAALLSIARGELNLRPLRKEYEFRGMNCIAIGVRLAEWEPNRLRSNRIWKHALDQFDRFILVTGSAHTGLALAELRKPFAAWVSSTVEMDRSERLAREGGVTSQLEKLGLRQVSRAEHRVLADASRILAVSNDTAQHLRGVAERNIEVWPYPIDTHRLVYDPEGHRDTPARFLFVGRANDPRKRVDLFFQACAALKRIAPSLDFTAVVVSSVLEREHEYPFPVEHVSGISDDELMAEYHRATALILTSEQEGLGIAAMEAMACGLPVISSRCGGPETFIVDGESGFFASDAPEAFAELMLRLATDDSLRKRVGMEARKQIDEQFSARVWNPRFEEMLKDLPV